MKTAGTIFDGGVIGADTNSLVIDLRYSDEFSITYTWTNDLSGDFDLEVTNDDSLAGGGVGWQEIPFTFAINPGGTPGSGYEEVVCKYRYARIAWDHTSGSGNLEMVVNVLPKFGKVS